MPRRRLAIALAVLFAAGILIGILLSGGNPPELRPARGPDADPLAYKTGDDAAFERRAANGESQPLYAKSPGGAIATARRVARFRPLIQAVAARHGVSPDDLESIVFLESAGRPDACASNDVSGACGLTQILAGTATGLLNMHVDLPKSKQLTKQILRAARKGKTGTVRKLQARRRRIDQRFDPSAALEGTGRYLEFAREKLGREDLALESYHMGVGNLQNALAAYGAGTIPYVRLYFDSTPLRHPAAYQLMAKLGDDSATYLWRLYAARDIMALSRSNPGELARLAALHDRKASAEEVLHPLADTKVFANGDAIHSGGLRALPQNARRLHMTIDPGMGELAPRLHEKKSLYRGLKPEALAMLVYIAAGTNEINGGNGTLNVTSTVRDQRYQRLLVADNIQATQAYSLHTTGYAFDIERRYSSRRQALAFQFMLDRLTALDMIAYAVEPDAIHITVSSDARVLEPQLRRVK